MKDLLSRQPQQSTYLWTYKNSPLNYSGNVCKGGSCMGFNYDACGFVFEYSNIGGTVNLSCEGYTDIGVNGMTLSPDAFARFHYASPTSPLLNGCCYQFQWRTGNITTTQAKLYVDGVLIRTWTAADNNTNGSDTFCVTSDNPDFTIEVTSTAPPGGIIEFEMFLGGEFNSAITPTGGTAVLTGPLMTIEHRTPYMIPGIIGVLTGEGCPPFDGTVNNIHVLTANDFLVNGSFRFEWQEAITNPALFFPSLAGPVKMDADWWMQGASKVAIRSGALPEDYAQRQWYALLLTQTGSDYQGYNPPPGTPIGQSSGTIASPDDARHLGTGNYYKKS